MIKTVVFDIGNVVWRFRPNFDHVFRRWAKILGLNLRQFRRDLYEKDHLYRHFETNSLTLRHWLNQIAPNHNPQIFIDILDQRFRHPVTFKNYLNQSIIKTIKNLKNECLVVGCLSNSENYIYPYLKKPIYSHFDYLIISWQVKCRKPDPQIYRQIFKHGHFLPSEILFVDDLPENLATAHKLGFNTLLFTTPSKFHHDLKKFIPI